MVSVIDETGKIFFERVYLLQNSRIASILALSQLSVCSHTPTSHVQAYFLISVQTFSPEWLLNFYVSTIHQLTWPSPNMGKKLRRNREIVGEWAVGVWEYTDSWLKVPIGASPEIEYKNAQRLF